MDASDRLGRGLLLAPPIFIAHFLEESPGFVPWFNAHVARGITPELFWTVNVTGLLVTVVLTLIYWTTRTEVLLLLSVAWLSFLMLANALFHVTGALVDGRYVPGLVTAVMLYLPYCAWMGLQVARARRLPGGLLAAAAVIGAVPMAVHGYRILFLGTRLF
jgi:hypothetical protein